MAFKNKPEFETVNDLLDQIVLLARGRGRNRDKATLESIEKAVVRYRRKTVARNKRLIARAKTRTRWARVYG